jgi:hypothetical protein
MSIFAKAINADDLQAAKLADLERLKMSDLSNSEWCRASLIDYWVSKEKFLPHVRMPTYGASAAGRINKSNDCLHYCHSWINQRLGENDTITIPFLYWTFQSGSHSGCAFEYNDNLKNILTKVKNNLTKGLTGQISYEHLLKFYKWFVGRNNPLMTELKKVADVDFHLAGDVPVGFSYNCKKVSDSLGGQLHSLSRCLVDFYEKGIYKVRISEFKKAVEAGLSTRAAIAWAEYMAYGEDTLPEDVDDPIWMDFDETTFYAWMIGDRDPNSTEWYTNSFKERSDKHNFSPSSLNKFKEQLKEWKMK